MHEPHQRRHHIHTAHTFGDHLADRVSAVYGSWPFIATESVFFALWITLNVIGWRKHWDAYPFVFMNLMLSFMAAYAGSILQKSQNRQMARDREGAMVQADEVHRSLAIATRMDETVASIHALTVGQNEVLALLRKHIAGDDP